MRRCFRAPSQIVAMLGTAFAMTAGENCARAQCLFATITPDDAAPYDNFGMAAALSADGGTLLVGAPFNGLQGHTGSAYVFVRQGDVWEQQAKLVPLEGVVDARFGSFLDISGDGNTAIVGEQFAPGGNHGYLFERAGEEWSQGLQLPGPAVGGYAWVGIAGDGDTAIVASSWHGQVPVYVRSGPTWVLQQTLIPSGPPNRFGGGTVDLSWDGTTAIVSDTAQNEGEGVAYIFDRAGAVWSETAQIVRNDPDNNGSFFGFGTLSADGNTALITAYMDDQIGSAYVFSRNGGTWQQEVKLVASDRSGLDQFGLRFQLSPDASTALISAPAGNEAYIFRRTGSSWHIYREDAQLFPPVPAGAFGAVAMSSDSTIVAVGAPLVNGNAGEGSGAVFIFHDGLDTDGDGLPDIWETEGIDIDDDGQIDLDLPAMGADPNHKDIFVEVDAMTGRAPLAHSNPNVPPELATNTSLDDVIEAFLNAPVQNPDQTSGIRLHVIVDETALPFAAWDADPWIQFDSFKESYFGSVQERGHANSAQILAAKARVFRYFVFADSIGGTALSGGAEIIGNDGMVTLGNWATPGAGVTIGVQAGTFMHEIGHNLGFRHGGADAINHKPNYRSVMNFTWQVPPASTLTNYFNSWALVFSDTELPWLDEASLDEPPGIGGDPSVWVPAGPNRFDRIFNYHLVPMGGPIDWSEDGDTDDIGVTLCPTVPCDLTRIVWSLPASPDQILNGHDDWSNIRYSLCGHGNFEDGAHPNYTEDEFSYDDYLNLFNECPSDLNGDCMVGVADLLILLGNWGNCVVPCPPICPADFDGDCTVGVPDLLTLLGDWGLCICGEGAPPPLSLEQVLTDACVSDENWDKFVEKMTDPNASQEDKDRYYCWMDHHLFDCTCLGCMGALCPGPDPYIP